MNATECNTHYRFYRTQLTDEYIRNMDNSIWENSPGGKGFRDREQFIRVIPSLEGRYAILKGSLPPV